MSSEPPVNPTTQTPAAAPAWQPPRVSKVEGGASPHVEKALADVRSKIHPRSVSGIFARWRVIMVVLTQLVFYGLPWLPDRKSVVWGKSVSVRFDLGVRRTLK